MPSGTNTAVRQSSRLLPASDEVRAELTRILESSHFQASKKRRAFLKFIVEETLAGRSGMLKGYAIAVEVYGRDETFDAKADPLIRLEARKLRRDLHSYYADAGRSDPVLISVPKGAYVAHFEPAEPVQALVAPEMPPLAGARDGPESATLRAAVPQASTWFTLRRKIWLSALVLAAVIIAAGMQLRIGNDPPAMKDSSEIQPAIAVLPFQSFGPSVSSKHLANGIEHEVIGKLLRFPSFRLYMLPVEEVRRGRSDPTRFGHEHGVAYAVTGHVNVGDQLVRIGVKLIDAMTGQVVWTGTYDRPVTPDSLMQVQSDLAGEIAGVLGQPYGVVNANLRSRPQVRGAASLPSYLCVMRAYDYRRRFVREKFAPVLQCLEAAVRRDPKYSDAWAMLGWLRVDATRLGYVIDGKRQQTFDKARQAASRAVELAPDNPRALKVLATVHHYMGHFDEGWRVARRALAANPHDPEAMAQLGWRLAARGYFEEGIPLLRRATERTLNPPGWYFHLIAIDHYLKGEFEQMLKVAERSAAGGRGVSQALIAIAATELGRRELARSALDEMAKYKSFARDPGAYIRRHGAIDKIADSIVTGLQKARQITSKL